MKLGHARIVPAVAGVVTLAAAVIAAAVAAMAGIAVAAEGMAVIAVAAARDVAPSRAGDDADLHFVVSEFSVVSQFCNFSVRQLYSQCLCG
jgi:hypothetical protein